MVRILPVIPLSLIATSGLAVAAVAPTTPSPMPQVKVRMKAVDTTSTELFNLAGQADPEAGPDQKLPDAAGWARIKADADQLKAVADWMRVPENGRTSEPKWMTSAEAMSDLSEAASKAAASHDAKALAKAANDLSDTCTACHSVYKNQS